MEQTRRSAAGGRISASLTYEVQRAANGEAPVSCHAAGGQYVEAFRCRYPG